MPTKATKPKIRKTKKKERQYRESFQTFFNSDPVAQQFIILLKELDFVPKVIDIYRNAELEERNRWQNYGIALSSKSFEQNFQRQEEFLLKYLPLRLYQATDTLVIEAIFAVIGRPMRRSLAIDLYNSIFVRRRDASAPPLRDGKNEIWDPISLNQAIAYALPTIKNPENITLKALAKSINALPRKGFLKNMKKDLTDKHLQKLLQEHHINWMRIKRMYKSILLEKRHSSKTT